jgi:hypothetical protein
MASRQIISETEIISKLSWAEEELRIIIEVEELSEFACSDLRSVKLLLHQVIGKIQNRGE